MWQLSGGQVQCVLPPSPLIPQLDLGREPEAGWKDGGGVTVSGSHCRFTPSIVFVRVSVKRRLVDFAFRFIFGRLCLTLTKKDHQEFQIFSFVSE